MLPISGPRQARREDYGVCTYTHAILPDARVTATRSYEAGRSYSSAAASSASVTSNTVPDTRLLDRLFGTTLA